MSTLALNVSDPDLLASYLTMAMDPGVRTQIEDRRDDRFGQYTAGILRRAENDLQRILKSENVTFHDLYKRLAFK
jgi:hypothetical protein